MDLSLCRVALAKSTELQGELIQQAKQISTIQIIACPEIEKGNSSIRKNMKNYDKL